MKKWIKRSMIIGGVWGLATGALYALGVYGAAFAGYSMGMLFKNTSIMCKIILLPAYLTDLFSGLLSDWLIPTISILVIWCIGLPILFGFIFGAGIGYLVDKFRKK